MKDSEIVTSAPPPDAPPEAGWDDVEAQLVAKDDAVMDERRRCAAVVERELEQGRMRGIPESSGTMVILHRIALAISNG